MRIAHVLQTSLDSANGGGIATYLNNIVPRQLDLGYDVKVLTNSRYAQYGNHSIPMKDFNFLKDKKLESLLHSLNVNSQLFFSNFDAVHYHFTPSAFFSFIPALRGKKRILTVHGRTEDARELSIITKKVLKFVNNKVIPKMDAITSVTPYLKQFLEENFQKENLYIPHGFNQATSREANQITKEFGLTKDSYFLALGRITQSKGFDTIIKAYSMLPETSKKLVIVGPPEEKYNNYLQTLVPPNLKEKIIFTGAAKGDKLDEFYSNAFAYIAGIETKGLSLTILEAIAHNIPVITSKVPGSNHKINEFTHRFETKNIQDLTNIIIEIESNSQKRKKYIEVAHQYASTHHSWDEIAKKFISLYH